MNILIESFVVGHFCFCFSGIFLALNTSIYLAYLYPELGLLGSDIGVIPSLIIRMSLAFIALAYRRYYPLLQRPSSISGASQGVSLLYLQTSLILKVLLLFCGVSISLPSSLLDSPETSFGSLEPLNGQRWAELQK